MVRSPTSPAANVCSVRHPRHWLPCTLTLLLLLCVQHVFAAADATPADMLKRADSIKTANQDVFRALLKDIEQRSAEFSPAQRDYFRYLQAWQYVYRGQYHVAVPELRKIIAQSSDPTVRFRASATIANSQTLASQYQESFSELSRMLKLLPEVTDPDARQQGLAVAVYLYNQVGEYAQAITYADMLIAENSGKGACTGATLKLEAVFKSSTQPVIGPEFAQGVETCARMGELLRANAIRSYIARLYLRQRRPEEAVRMLNAHYDEVQRTRYPRGISEYDALLAEAYLAQGDPQLAKQYALKAIANAVADQYKEPLVSAYQTLYLLTKEQGDMSAALAYHEKYSQVDKNNLDDVSARQLAFERAKHENASNKLQIDALNQENRLLQLQRQLDSKAAEASRLYIALLLMVVMFIALWAYRTKRSQLHFMKLSQMDGLTGIANRPRFIELAENVLQAALKSQQQVSVVLCDLDYFKSINDRYGHAAGDHVLRQTVLACQSHLRISDVFGRVGGEEFGIVLPSCGLEDAKQRAEQLRLAVNAIAPLYDGERCPVSASFGVTSTECSGYELRQLLAHADWALYRAKANGRDRVTPYDPGAVADPSILRIDDELRNASRA
jgi:diguanylate cyclase (GGDEF)-like protein